MWGRNARGKEECPLFFISEIDRRDACPTVGRGIASVALLPRNDRMGIHAMTKWGIRATTIFHPHPALSPQGRGEKG